jgi:DNA-binding NarL/FixJ family response regulator
MTDQPLHIVVTGRHPEIVPTVVRLLCNTPNRHLVGTLSNEETLACMQRHHVDLLLLSSGINEDEEQQLRSALRQTHLNAIVIQHYGGGSGLLNCEILAALANR